MKPVEAEDKTRKRLLGSVLSRKNLSPDVQKCAVGVIKGMTGRLLQRNKKNLLFIVLSTAHAQAGEHKSIQQLATELDIRGKIRKIPSRANLVQLNGGETESSLLETIHISTASEVLDRMTRKLDAFDESHLNEMQSLLKRVLERSPELSSCYPQKVATAFLCMYADINKIALPESVEDERSQKLVRTLKQSLATGP